MAAELATLRDGIEPSGQLLPPGQTIASSYQTPRVSAGSFLVGETVRGVDPARMMPTEEVLPGAYVPLLIIPNLGVDGRWDYDHTRFQGNDSRMQGSDRRPLRYCFGQYIPRPTHERKNVLFDAVEIPTDAEAIFQSVLLGLAKYVPKHMVDLSDGTVVVREANDSLREEVRRNVAIQPGTGWRLGYYAAQYILTNGLEAVRETAEVDKFLEANDEHARKRASYGVVRQAVGVVTDSFEPTYEKALKRGAIRRPEPTAARFISRFFDSHQPDYVSTIADALLR
jgi:hypothetical protein